MAELMKARINADSLGELARRIKKNHPAFESEDFVSEILDADWESLELKARIRKTALAFCTTLPADYSQAVTILRQTAADYPADRDGLMLMCIRPGGSGLGRIHGGAGTNDLAGFGGIRRPRVYSPG